MTRVMVLDGVNLGRLGVRQPDVYGRVTHAELVEHLIDTGRGMGLTVEVRQTDAEAEMVAWLHEAADTGCPVVLNPGAWSHYSYAVRDAAVEVEFMIEVHISNIHAREDFRHTSVVSPVASGVIAGLGLAGYDYALAHIASIMGSLDEGESGVAGVVDR